MHAARFAIRIKKILAYLTLILLTIMCSQSLWAAEFSEYTSKTEVPEPLFIDLVRSLDAKKGEWEINSLFSHSNGSFNDINWAPEVEFVPFNGLGLEFEFPMQGDTLKYYKFAVQKTLNSFNKGKSLHGLQLIYETDVDFKYHDETLFYILAHRFNFHLSSMTLAGFKKSSLSNETIWSYNQTFFYNYSREVDFGLEFNYFSGDRENRLLQIIPQIHLAFKDGYKIQWGFGSEEIGSQWQPLAVFRLIKEFNSSH